MERKLGEVTRTDTEHTAPLLKLNGAIEEAGALFVKHIGPTTIESVRYDVLQALWAPVCGLMILATGISRYELKRAEKTADMEILGERVDKMESTVTQFLGNGVIGVKVQRYALESAKRDWEDVLNNSKLPVDRREYARLAVSLIDARLHALHSLNVEYKHG